MSKPHNTHYMYTYIHTDYTYTHTYLQTNTYIHQYMHVHTDTPHPPTGGAGHTIHTHIHTYIQIHTYIHTCMYIQTRPPNPQGGRGEDHLSPLHTKTCAPRPFGGGWGVGPADLDHIYIEEVLKIRLKTWRISSSLEGVAPQRLHRAVAPVGLVGVEAALGEARRGPGGQERLQGAEVRLQDRTGLPRNLITN